MFRCSTLPLLIVAGSIPAAPIPKELRNNDHGMIVGTWKLVSSGSGGNLNPGDGSKWQFDEKGGAAIIRAGGKADGNIKFTIDPTTTPKKFDWLPPWGQYRGVYTLENDKLVLYIRNSANDANRVREAIVAQGVEVYSFERETTK
jgi:uncharacterized protein (TIGR03067 family)